MKKIFACLLMGCMIMGLSMVSFAASEGDIYQKDSDGYISDSKGASPTLIPGSTYYVYICPGNTNDPKPASKAYISTECINRETDKKFSILPSSLSIVKRRMSNANNDYAYFAEMRLKEIPVSSYSFDGYELEFTKFNENRVANDVNAMLTTFTVKYPQGSEITEDLQYFELEDTSDYFYVDGTSAEVRIDSEGVKTKTIIACDTSYDSAFGDKHYNANLTFYYFNGAKLRRPATVTIPTSDGKYLYEVTSAGLKEITRKNNDKFEFKTPTLGRYVLSDKKLSSISDETIVEPTPETPIIPSVPGTPDPVPEVLPNLPGAPTGGYYPYNPGTGAAI